MLRPNQESSSAASKPEWTSARRAADSTFGTVHLCCGRHFWRGEEAAHERFRRSASYTVALPVHTVIPLLDSIVYRQHRLERPHDRAPWCRHQQRRDGTMVHPRLGRDRERFARSKQLYRRQQNLLRHADVLQRYSAKLAKRLLIDIIRIAAGASEQLIEARSRKLRIVFPSVIKFPGTGQGVAWKMPIAPL